MNTVLYQDAEKMLTELIRHHYERAKTADRSADSRSEIYAIGKTDGALDALQCVYFNLFGGRKTAALMAELHKER